MSDLDGKSVYSMWNARNRGSSDYLMFPTEYPAEDEVSAENPQPGMWKVWGGYVDPDNKRAGSIRVPMQVWLVDEAGATAHNWRSGLKLAGTIDGQHADSRTICDRWLGSTAITKAVNAYYKEHGRWPEDLEPVGAAAKAEAAKKDKEAYAAATAPPALKLALEPVPQAVEPGGTEARGIGDNSGPAGVEPLKPERNRAGLAIFRNHLITIEADVAEAKAHLARNRIETKVDADKVENWRKRIDKAGKEAEAARKAENKPFDDVIAEINASYKAIIAVAQTQAKAMGSEIDAWATAEQKRLDDEARAAAKAKLDKEREAARLAQEAAAKRHAEEKAAHDALKAADPVMAEITPEPEAPQPVQPIPAAMTPVVAAAPKVMIGTVGSRRSVKAAPKSAIITDLVAAARHLAGLQDKDLVALVQKRADAAAKAGVAFPGCVLSGAAEAAE